MTNPTDNTCSNTAAALEFGRKTSEPKVLDLEHEGIKGQVLLTPNGLGGTDVASVKDLVDEYRKSPERRRGTIFAHDLASFIYLTNRDADTDSVIFARRGKINGETPRLTAVLNFHKQEVGEEIDPKNARFCDDRIRYDFPLSDEWNVWTTANGEEKKMGQEQFARFIENNLFDIGEPEAKGGVTGSFIQKTGMRLAGPNDMLALSKGLEVRTDCTFRKVVNLQDGTQSFAFSEQNTDADGAPLKVPGAFHVMIPVFRNGTIYSIPVRLRYRVGGGKVVWWFEMHRADQFFDAAITDVLARVRRDEDGSPGPTSEPVTLTPGPDDKPLEGGCNLPVVLGTPPGVSTDNN